MSKFLKSDWPIFVLLILAFLTRFLFLYLPSEVVFDEVHFGKFISAYFNHKYYFDIHPPLGKLLIASVSESFGFRGDFNISQIGEEYDAFFLFILRFLPALFGSLLIPLVYLLLKSLGGSKKTAFAGAYLFLFDNAFLIQSRFILVDIFLIFFGILSFYFFILSRKQESFNKKWFLFLILAGIFSGFAITIKWTGLGFLVVMALFIFYDLLKNLKIKDFLVKITIFTIIPFLIYFSSFAIHFKLVNQSGAGDPFMSSAFQKTLLGNEIIQNSKPLSTWKKFTELNMAMYKYNAGVQATHPDSSKWFEWPIMRKPIFYWTKDLAGEKANIYLLGNPLVWWLVALAIPFSLFIALKKSSRKKLSPLIYILLFGYFINLLPFIFINRVTFLYHYLPSLTFGIILSVLLIEKVLKPRRFLFFGFLIIIFLIFLFLAPISYGFPVSPKINELQMLFIKLLS